MMNLEEALAAAAKIPACARADWDGTNHYEISTDEPLWLICSEVFVGPPRDISASEEGKRMGAVLDAACAAPILAAEVARLRAEITDLEWELLEAD